MVRLRYTYCVRSQPIVSVIVPTKNSSRTLKRCLESIRNQTYPHIQIIVVDNFSTDDTGSIAKKFANEHYLMGPERCSQRNYGVAKSKGTFVAIIDSDMYLSPNVIESAVTTLSQEDVAGVVVPEVSIGNGFWAKCKALERSFYVGQPYMEAARIFRKSDFTAIGGYNESMVSGEDWDLSQRIAVMGKLVSIQPLINHDEGKISLLRTVGKKYYYASHFEKYMKKNSGNSQLKKQTSILGRYALFFSKPASIVNSPIIFLGMLFMKTCEFLFGGIGLVVSKFSAASSQ